MVALNRISGQFFAYLAESGDGGKTVARQRGVELGPIVGNDYVVKSGLKPGEKLIVSGVQKIGDGSPVTVQAAARRRRAAGRRRQGRRLALFSDAFIRRPILASVCSLIIILAGAICIPLLPIARYPRARAAAVRSSPSTPAPTPRRSRARSRRRSSR